jgi:hypothetical protein
LLTSTFRTGTGSSSSPRSALPFPTRGWSFVSADDEDYRVAEAIHAGAHGYLLKEAPVRELLDGIRSAAAGRSPRIASAVVRAVQYKSYHRSAGTLGVLSPREVQVLRLLATAWRRARSPPRAASPSPPSRPPPRDGLATREIAASLGISPKTVETHRIRLYTKLGYRSVVALVRIAVRSGLVEASKRKPSRPITPSDGWLSVAAATRTRCAPR